MACENCRYSLFDFFQIVADDEKLWKFLQEHGALPPAEGIMCPNCNVLCVLYKSSQYRYKCTRTVAVGHQKKKRCNFEVSAKKGTFFENAHLPIDIICRFVGYWLFLRYPKQETIQEELDLSSKTVVDWSSFCREVCLAAMCKECEQLGGENCIVEIDEAKLGKRKYNRGRVIEGQWIFGGFERETKKTFLVPVPDRTKETLLAVIKQWILPGTTVISDCWKSYDCLEDENFQHHTVNHSVNFVDPHTGAHTQNIERTWRDVREHIPKYGRKEEHYDGYLATYLFMRKYKDKQSRYHHFFKYIGDVYPPTVLKNNESESE